MARDKKPRPRQKPASKTAGGHRTGSGDDDEQIALERIRQAVASNASELDLSFLRITSLPDEISGLTGLTSLNLIGTTGVADLAPLSGLSGLTALHLRGTGVADLAPLSGLTGLTSLYLGDTGVADLAPLSGLTGLTALYLRGTGVADLAPLSGLTGLTTLYLGDTGVADLAPLSGLTGLTDLDLRGTGVADLAPLSGLTGLTSLYLGDTGVADLAPLSGLTGLKILHLRGTGVADLAPLSGLTGLTDLDLRGTGVADLAPLSGLTGLTSLNLRGTGLADLTPLSGLSGLTSLDLRGTGVSDLKVLARLIMLSDAAVSSQSRERGLLDAGLEYADTPITRTAPFATLSQLDQPACTVETINYLRRQEGLEDYLPDGYERPDGIEEIFAGGSNRPSSAAADGGAQQPDGPPQVPPRKPAALEPVVANGRIDLPHEAARADLPEGDMIAALAALKAELNELADDVDEDEGNIDKRVVKQLRSIADLVPDDVPPQAVLFRLAHRQEMLTGYGKTVAEEWPEILASRYLILCRQFDRTVRQFPRWREFLSNAADDQFDDPAIEAVGSIAHEAAEILSQQENEPFVSPEVAGELEELAEPLQQKALPFDPYAILEEGKDLLAKDVLESISNILKLIAKHALPIIETAKETVKGYGKGLKERLPEAAEEQGRKDADKIIKWSRRILLGAAGAAPMHGLLVRLIEKFPDTFYWLEPILKFIGTL